MHHGFLSSRQLLNRSVRAAVRPRRGRAPPAKPAGAFQRGTDAKKAGKREKASRKNAGKGKTRANTGPPRSPRRRVAAVSKGVHPVSPRFFRMICASTKAQCANYRPALTFIKHLMKTAMKPPAGAAVGLPLTRLAEDAP
jgi:hypothetical protein